MTDVRDMYIGDRVRAAAKVGGLTGELFAAAADEIDRLRRLLTKRAEHVEDGNPNYITLVIKHVGQDDLLCAVSPDIPGLMVAGRSLSEVLGGVPGALAELTHCYALHARGRL